MITRLDGLGLGNTWAGEQSRYQLALVDDANQRIAQLEAAWQAMEQHDTGNLTLEQTQDAIDRAEPSELRPPVYLT